MNSTYQERSGAERAGGRAWLARNGAAVLVAAGAAAATAHGLYEVAEASKVPAPIAWLYPVITDGLGAVAYSATSRLRGKAAGYAWACVVLAAGLSGLAQAVYLAADTVAADPVLRFGVGAWPAIACALVAHLLHLTLTTNQHQQHDAHHDGDQHDGDQHDGQHSHQGPEGQLEGEPMAALPAAPVADIGAEIDTEIGADVGGGFGAEIGGVGEDVAPGAAHDDDAHDDDAHDDDAHDDVQEGDEAGADQACDGDGGDVRVRLLRELLAAGADITGPQAAALLSHRAGSAVSDRTARRLLAAARDTSADTDRGWDDTAGTSQGALPRARLVLLPTGTATTNRTSSDTDEGDPR